MTLSVALMGTDLIGQARTGTGKTLAFGIPVIQRIASPTDPDYADVVTPGKPQALIVAPTRELAIQVSEAFEKYAAHMKGVKVLPIYGGQGYGVQLSALRRGVHVVVPGVLERRPVLRSGRDRQRAPLHLRLA
jgi:superfamily II DNA/RNA helicase